MAGDEAAYREYVATRLDRLRRTAYLMCGDWHTADDLVANALVKLYRHWSRVSRMDNIDAYVRRVLMHTAVDERRRPWRRESSAAEPPDHPAGGDEPGRLTDRVTILGLLAELPPRRRAVLVLRFFCDLSVEETAEVLGCTAGTVKSQTSRGVEALRARIDPSDGWADRVSGVRGSGAGPKEA